MPQRPWWMTGLFVFCGFMTFVYCPYDLFWKPVAHDDEIWLGFALSGWAAKATEPLHWAIYAAGLAGFWNMRPWMHPWAAIYSGSIAVGMVVWAVRDSRVSSLPVGLAGFLAFAVLAIALWRARDRFNPR
jgi:hypothetical protein